MWQISLNEEFYSLACSKQQVGVIACGLLLCTCKGSSILIKSVSTFHSPPHRIILRMYCFILLWRELQGSGFSLKSPFALLEAMLSFAGVRSYSEASCRKFQLLRMFSYLKETIWWTPTSKELSYSFKTFKQFCIVSIDSDTSGSDTPSFNGYDSISRIYDNLELPKERFDSAFSRNHLRNGAYYTQDLRQCLTNKKKV